MRRLEDQLRRVPPATVARIHTRLGRIHRGLSMVMFPAFFAVGAWMAWQDLQPMLSWRATDAIVMQSDVERAPVLRPPARWRPRVQYRWEADRRGYTGDRLARTETWFRRRSDAWKVANRYTGEQRVTAWVDPKDPSVAVLDRRPNFFPYLFLLVTAVLAWFFAFLADPRERRWHASGPGWTLDARMPGTPAAAAELSAARDGTTGEVVTPASVENRPIE